MQTPPASTAANTRVRVWDLPTRMFHWALAVCVIGLGVTGTVGGEAMNWHLRLGYCALTLLLFRLVWGLVGGHWSRFASFIFSPGSLLAYLRGRGRPEHSIGHSPLGALAVFAMIAVLVLQVGSGLLSDDEIAFSGPLTRFVANANVSLATFFHKNIGKWLLLALVISHLVAIAVYVRRRQPLVAAMLHGDKTLTVTTVTAISSRDDTRSRALALLVLLACAALAYWVSSLAAVTF